MIKKGESMKRNENSQRKHLQHQNAAQKSVVFHSVPKPTPLLSDRNEFPSLNESTGRASSSSHVTYETLTYSDKLKSHSFQNQMCFNKNLHFKTNTVVTNMYSQFSDKATRTKSQKCTVKNKSDSNTHQNIPKNLSTHSLKEDTSLIEAQQYGANKNTKKDFVNNSASLKSISDNTSAFISNNANLFPASSNPTQSSKSGKSTTGSSKLKEETDITQGSSKAKKKNKRKSKVKRQVSLQSGKLTVLTPELHLKILNQTSALTTQHFKSVLTDINDEDEYPELGKPLPISQKENFQKKDVSSESQKEIIDKLPDTSTKKDLGTESAIKESSEATPVEKVTTEKKGKSDNKEKVHSYDPITISFFDMLLDKNIKPKVKDDSENPTNVGLPKIIKFKKNKCNPHNLLDSSSPAIKRGKEREKPKTKKPSQMKKIILLDRKTRREHLLQMKGANEEGNILSDNEIVTEVNTDENTETSTENTSFLVNNNVEDDPLDLSELDEDDNQVVFLSTEDADLNMKDELSEMEHLNFSEVQENYSNINNSSSIPIEDIKIKDFIERCTLNKVSKNEEDTQGVSQIIPKSSTSSDAILKTPRSPDTLLNSLIGNAKPEGFDKEKAAKILLHTRHFREYCNHLISKDIDDTVFALLDDLVRFQDRLHQKDPIKARMKRRLIYGVKEVKKHIKLKKLKCIIIAVDIENVETQGGLNDVLNDIKMSAADHHIPCIFALSRKVLGKLCHKPVPVSCVGVFNFEGSEANFKMMIELQTQSKTDYADIFNKLLLRLTEEEVATLLKAKKETPESLRALRTNILNDFFQESKINKVENDSTNIKSVEQMSDLINSEA